VQRRSVLLLDTAVPLIVGAVIVLASVVHRGTNVRPLTLAVVAATAAALAGRRRAPGWTLAISGGLVLILFHIDAAVGSIAVLAPAVALYSLALTRGRVQQLLAAVAAVAAVIVTDLIYGSQASIVQTLAHVTLVAIPLLAAETLRTRRSYVALLVERLELVERTREQEAQHRAEQERMRIARDLHDIVAHTLTTINVQAATAAQLLDCNPGHARAALETIEDASRDAIAELRAMVGVLRDSDHPDAPRTPAPGVENIAELVGRARETGLEIRLETTGARPGRLPDAVSLAAYRIVQESLTNARRHATGAPIRINLSFEPGELAIAVENGAGAAGEGKDPTVGVGIIGMTERATAVGGTLRAAPLACGFRVDASLPYALGGA
jgi:signal transduction histidine kinase